MGLHFAITIVLVGVGLICAAGDCRCRIGFALRLLPVLVLACVSPDAVQLSRFIERRYESEAGTHAVSGSSGILVVSWT